MSDRATHCGDMLGRGSSRRAVELCLEHKIGGEEPFLVDWWTKGLERYAGEGGCGKRLEQFGAGVFLGKG